MSDSILNSIPHGKLRGFTTPGVQAKKDSAQARSNKTPAQSAEAPVPPKASPLPPMPPVPVVSVPREAPSLPPIPAGIGGLVVPWSAPTTPPEVFFPSAGELGKPGKKSDTTNRLLAVGAGIMMLGAANAASRQNDKTPQDATATEKIVGTFFSLALNTLGGYTLLSGIMGQLPWGKKE